jgi:hypothetical protein
MIEVRPATTDEMILAFLQGDIDTRTDRASKYAAALASLDVDRATLIDRGDVNDAQGNNRRRWLLDAVRGYERQIALFVEFPADTQWRLITVTPTEVRRFKYVNHQAGWARVSGSTRLVADGVRNLDQPGNEEIKGNVTGIADRLRQGKRFPPLIAVQCTGIADVVLMEGHTRATAYALTNLPDEIQAFIGTSRQMGGWRFFF